MPPGTAAAQAGMRRAGGRYLPPPSPPFPGDEGGGGGRGGRGGRGSVTARSPSGQLPAPYHGVGGARQVAERGAGSGFSPRMLGAARAPAAGREAARARAGRKRCRRHGPPCPEEEAVAMVGALRGNAPDPRLRAHARPRPTDTPDVSRLWVC
ncbi:homeobox protein Hox-D9-like isoform X1 [Aquila chrysaetos chrysaetos]|uniref:homeobox protein Hox-D9-like isoform X1 n=1 Tax=Aquila chrysaetos chrysaetos TaxID=223781 RepID=UPI001B7D3F68|nr:homeobox protein Hox-D9-like isoform X1 [Aquila chrysaetos chrysaetos]